MHANATDAPAIGDTKFFIIISFLFKVGARKPERHSAIKNDDYEDVDWLYKQV